MKQFGMLLLGFCIGVASVVLFAGLVAAFIFMDWNDEPTYSDDHETDMASLQDEYFSLHSRAYLDEKPCPTQKSDDFVGFWYGKTNDQSWLKHTKPDGTFVIAFAYQADDQNTTRIQVEKGYWAQSNCLYTSVTTHIDEEPALFQEVYRTHQITPNEQTYTSYRSGTTYTTSRTSKEEVPEPKLLESIIQ